MLVQTMLALALLTVPQDPGRGGASGVARPIAAKGDSVAAVREARGGETPPVAPEAGSPDAGGVLTDASAPVTMPSAAPRPAADTPVKRERAVEYSDWYARRLISAPITGRASMPRAP